MPDEQQAGGAALIDIYHTYGAAPVLRGVSLDFPPSTVTALVGENGAGKSTLLKILGGEVRPSSGGLLLYGEPVDFGSYTPARAQRTGIAIVHQEQALVGPLSVAENISLGHEPRTTGPVLDRKAMRGHAEQMLAELGSEIDPDRPVEELSLAQRQLVEIAKALSHGARVVALDEPSAVLSGAELERLFSVVERLVRRGVAVVYVSHRMDEIFRLCQRYVVLRDGVVAGAGAVADVEQDQLIQLMVGRPVSALFPAGEAVPGPVRLEVGGLTVPGKVSGVDLSVRAGEVVGIAGLSGSGRSTLAKALFGAVPARGSVSVDGRRVGPFGSPRAAIRAGVAYLPEDRKAEALALRMPVRWNLTSTSLDRVTSRLGLVRRAVERRVSRGIVEQLAIKVPRGGEEPAAALSGGNQQKVVLGKWLQVEPKVLILDEPTRGVDVGAKEQIYRELRALTDEGLAVLVISSELVEVLGLSDRVLVMASGRIVGQLEGDDATEENVMALITRASPHPTAVTPA
ncbi:MAG: hypothetical protein JWO67_3303 [Streptosporangiaceae bacterium]|nr:hypothetical protein [Streptosporangiaceae bacterium]